MKHGVTAPLLVAVCVALTARRAEAHLLPYYDLPSLAFSSRAVVECTPRPPFVSATISCRIEQSFVGPLLRNDAIQVDLRGYLAPAALREVSSVVVFLDHMDSTAWSVVPSGVRPIVHGRVYRFIQEVNPGGYAMVPQRTPADDVLGAPEQDDSDIVDRTRFIQMIQDATQRAFVARVALAVRSRWLRDAMLLAVLPTPWDGLSARSGARGYGNRIGDAAIEFASREHDLDLTLELLARGAGSHGFSDRFTATEYFASALDRTRPDHQRVAAIHEWLERADEVPFSAALEARVRLLATDAQPAVRAAALETFRAAFSHRAGFATISTAIAAAIAHEPDARVLSALSR